MKSGKNGLFRKIVCIILVVLILGSLVSGALIMMVNAASSAEIKQKLSGLRNQQADLQKQSDALQSQISENKQETQTLVERKADIDQSIEMTQEKINNLNEMIQQYSLLIAEKQKELDESLEQEAVLNAQYKVRIRTMEESGTISYWSILFKSKSFADLLDRVDMIREIAESDQLMMKKLAAMSEKIESERQELEQEMAELEQAKADVAEEEATLEAQREESNELILEMLRAYEEMNSEYEDYLVLEEELSKKIAASETEYFNALAAEEAARIAAKNAQNNYVPNNSGSSSGNNSGGSSGGSSGGFLYPLPYQVSITDAYGYRIHPLSGQNSWHNGVDFAAGAGTSIYATKSGTVTTAAYSEAWGYYVVINHGDGYSSLYAHMPSLSVSSGQYVTQGQTIGSVGSTGYSTGPHLHFTIYYNGADVNPMSYV